MIFKFRFQIPTVKHCKLQTYLSNVQQFVSVSNAHLSWHLDKCDKCDNQWQLKVSANKSGGWRPQSVPIPWWWHDDTRAGNGASQRFRFHIEDTILNMCKPTVSRCGWRTPDTKVIRFYESILTKLQVPQFNVFCGLMPH